MTSHGTTRQILLAVVGPGLVGSALLEQLSKQATALTGDPYHTQLALIGICNSRNARLATPEKPIPTQDWKRELNEGTPSDLQKFSEHVEALQQHYGRCILVDSSASAEVPRWYSRWLAAGIHVITPNKQLGAGPLKDYLAVKGARPGSFWCEATVGAGLPIISTLQTLLHTGDSVHLIEGVFSGSLSFIFNTLSHHTFSQAVQEAQAEGFTEPDPRIDLSGVDVARKAVILARECGLRLSLEDVEVESLVPDKLKHASDADFMQKLPQFESMTMRVSAAKANKKVLRYVGAVNVASKHCSVSLQEYDDSHPFAGLAGSDNVFAFHTERYSPNPLVIRGAGAGGAVTAMGVFGDILQALARIP